ncbi:Chromosome (plasmid) partitioning protein ParB / Stage 0 sporulation protein J [Rubellimicrobium mesophilum DSM 19309]|uniref:Chromosome (Plasmid) partitioning protein ParB / Stage 0 sporulation protein J n=1 Tax=Rubellimicrobium mesophilum DSM 19309 TaxID=442562 RepID=A0A017HK57_9RHOB|nr:ParB/RepB/Spo0J family partition protein [Rubellimicrobium mesophilum]EYD74149.1 Chromosome (plasmid) partitioning protein ParB / Stage 0 sporulation protein J [Rubellimicrobium mesophilum DSM 19309]
MAEKPLLKRGLGRGLSALMADLGTDLAKEAEAPPVPRTPDRMMPVESLRPNPDQPRRTFDPAALDDLAASLKSKGVIQPLIVRPDPTAPGAWQIVAGERRWRAAQKAGLTEVPVIVRDYDDAELLEIAIIENVQRDDLNPIDEGAAYRSLIDRFGHSQEQVASALGKSRSHVANQMRLLSLPREVQQMVADRTISAGHARPLIGHPRAIDLARRIAERGLSARDAERIAKTPATEKAAPRARAEKDADTRAIEGELSAALKMAVRIDHGAAGEGGRLSITYKNLEQLDDLLSRLSGG